MGFMALFSLEHRHQNHPASNGDDVAPVVIATPEVDLIFESNEAMLSVNGRKFITDISRNIVGHQILISITHSNDVKASTRLEQWELSAARMAAVGRFIEKLGGAKSQINFDGPRQTPSSEHSKLVLTNIKPK